MQGQRIIVVSDVRPVRESLRLLLHDSYDVVPLTPLEAERQIDQIRSADLLITDATCGAVFQTARAGLPPEIPQLTIAVADENAGGQLPFQPGQLLQQVETLLSRSGSLAYTHLGEALRPPFVPINVADLALRAARTDFPILITGEAGTGKSRIARALHALSGGRFLMLPPDQLELPSLEHAFPTGGLTTLYVAEIADLGPRARGTLRDLLEAGGTLTPAGWVTLRLIAASNLTVTQLHGVFAADPGLFHRLSTLTLHLPPLRQRLADIPALAQYLAARMLGRREPVQFTAAALARLQDYLWFGNVAELEAVIARTLTMRDGAVIDADDLAFSSSRPKRVEPEAVPSASASATAAPAQLDLVIAELAHEFKNPMVVIKTAAQHLERLLEDQSGRKEMAKLTGEAVDRMDRALENLLQFTRFEEPVRHDIALNELLTACLSTLNPEFNERKVMLDYHPPDRQTIAVDVLQISYAIENLLRVVLRDLGSGASLTIRPLLEHAGVSIEFKPSSHAVSKHLAAASGDSHEMPEVNSLGFWFARVLVERNGGALRYALVDERMVITIEMPEGGHGVEGHEEAARFDS